MTRRDKIKVAIFVLIGLFVLGLLSRITEGRNFENTGDVDIYETA